jgi:hypothetical protein
MSTRYMAVEAPKGHERPANCTVSRIAHLATTNVDMSMNGICVHKIDGTEELDECASRIFRNLSEPCSGQQR